MKKKRFSRAVTSKIIDNIIPIIPFIIILVLIPTKESFACIISSLIHEGGHFLAMAVFSKRGYGRGGVGGLTIHIPSYGGTGKKIVISASGCLLNFAVVLFVFLFLKDITLAAPIMYSCLTIGIFNLLPVKGLDGGEILEAIIERCFLPRTAYIICRAFSLIFIFLIWIFSVYTLLMSDGNITLFALSLSLFCSFLKDG